MRVTVLESRKSPPITVHIREVLLDQTRNGIARTLELSFRGGQDFVDRNGIDNGPGQAKALITRRPQSLIGNGAIKNTLVLARVFTTRPLGHMKYPAASLFDKALDAAVGYGDIPRVIEIGTTLSGQGDLYLLRAKACVLV